MVVRRDGRRLLQIAHLRRVRPAGVQAGYRRGSASLRLRETRTGLPVQMYVVSESEAVPVPVRLRAAEGAIERHPAREVSLGGRGGGRRRRDGGFAW